MDNLEGLSVYSIEGRAEHFMPLRQQLEGEAQRLRVESADKAEIVSKIISGSAWLKLIQEPESTLCEGSWRWLRA